jgi:hypothetical protein
MAIFATEEVGANNLFQHLTYRYHSPELKEIDDSWSSNLCCSIISSLLGLFL